VSSTDKTLPAGRDKNWPVTARRKVAAGTGADAGPGGRALAGLLLPCPPGAAGASAAALIPSGAPGGPFAAWSNVVGSRSELDRVFDYQPSSSASFFPFSLLPSGLYECACKSLGGGSGCVGGWGRPGWCLVVPGWL
jgi:hypothetical protein